MMFYHSFSENQKNKKLNNYENITKTTAAALPGGSKKRISNNNDKHDHGQEKRGPFTYAEGRTISECMCPNTKSAIASAANQPKHQRIEPNGTRNTISNATHYTSAGALA